MQFVPSENGSTYETDAPNWLSAPERQSFRIAITADALKRRIGRSLRWQLGQLYGIVGPGAINARFVYKGLKRRMYVSENHDADGDKLALTWRPANDFRFDGNPFSGEPVSYPAPENSLFVVYLSPNEMCDEFPNIDGWIEHWAWIDADPQDPARPVQWAERYDCCVWQAD